MRKIPLILLVLFFIILSCCTNLNSNNLEITEEKAKQMIRDEYSSKHGQAEIISVMSTSKKYIIHWEVDPIEEGKDSVNKKTSKIKIIDSSHGSCEWK